MNLAKKIVFLFLPVLDPLKTETMNLIRTKWAYMAVACLLFLQIPILPAGSLSAKHKFNLHVLTAPEPVEEKTISTEELIVTQADSIYDTLKLVKMGLTQHAFELAYKGYFKLVDAGKVEKPGILTIADFSKSSKQRRLYIIDMNEGKILFHTLVAHGRNSGLYYASSFSNTHESNKSSLGFYLTLDTYYGDKGYSLKLRGLERGINDNAYDRNIVMHGSDYVTSEFARSNGYLGRSLGCPAIPTKQTKGIINTVKNGSVLFIYHPSKNYAKQSQVLNS
jgi:hypothetical protein